MPAIFCRDRIRRGAIAAAALAAVVVFAIEARAIHPRRAIVAYSAAGCGPLGYPPAYPGYVGPSSWNPEGFGFGGYSYGGYPYYGYWGYMPGPYEGIVAPGPAYGLVGYGPGACVPPVAEPCAPVCAAPVAPYTDPCVMTRCAYRRYMRRLCRAMARSAWPCAPMSALGCCAACLDTSADDEIVEATETGWNGVVEPGSATDGAVEQVAPPAEERPEPMLERSL
jgi:hypothetical protein